MSTTGSIDSTLPCAQPVPEIFRAVIVLRRFRPCRAARLSAKPTQRIIVRADGSLKKMSHDVLDFWFDPANRDNWFEASADFDELVRKRLGAFYAEAVEGRCNDWKNDRDGALALCILFDQVPRNIFRGSARAFATDPQARSLARHILASGFDRLYPTDDHRLFCYLPFEHSEDVEDQRLGLELLTARTADDRSTHHAQRHLEVITKFGRFPHRNAVLGRPSTSAELEFLKAGGSSL